MCPHDVGRRRIHLRCRRRLRGVPGRGEPEVRPHGGGPAPGAAAKDVGVGHVGGRDVRGRHVRRGHVRGGHVGLRRVLAPLPPVGLDRRVAPRARGRVRERVARRRVAGLAPRWQGGGKGRGGAPPWLAAVVRSAPRTGRSAGPAPRTPCGDPSLAPHAPDGRPPEYPLPLVATLTSRPARQTKRPDPRLPDNPPTPGTCRHIPSTTPTARPN